MDSVDLSVVEKTDGNLCEHQCWANAMLRFLRRFGQSDFFIARSFRRANKRFIGVKRNRVFLRILRSAAADDKSPDEQNQTNRCAQNQNNDKVLFFS